ncbi:hypothetical protein [Actinosynnema sp. NPDC023587]|uniref:hypothetical protein n=1 Tax=Actinosynnema sp. NPDC023587 TaxID=3154695 RepID=UPI0033E105AE
MVLRVLVDGPDFAGKSTVCAELVSALRDDGLAVLHTIGAAHPWLAGTVGAVHRADFLRPGLRGAFYLVCPALERLATPGLRRAERGHQVHLVEGGYDRVAAFHLARGQRLRARWARRLAWPPADLAVFLDADDEVRAARYRASGQGDQRDGARFDGSARARHRAHCAAFRELASAGGYVRVDSSDESPQQTVQRFRSLVHEKLRDGEKVATSGGARPSVLIEGHDLSGKSTTVRLLAERWRGGAVTVRKGPLVPLPFWRWVEAEMGRSQPRETLLGLCFAVQTVADGLRVRTSARRPLVQESSILRAVAHNYARRKWLTYGLLRAASSVGPRFDHLAVLMVADPEEITRRAHRRDALRFTDRLFVEDAEYRRRWCAEALRQAARSARVSVVLRDTGAWPLAELAAGIVAQVGGGPDATG